MTTLQEAARDALEALERIGKDFVCRSAHHAKKDQHSAFAECPVVVRHTDAIESLRTALAQQGEQQVCAGCGIPVGDVHMSTCKSGKWPSRVSNGDTAAPAPAPAPQPAQGVPEVGFGNMPYSPYLFGELRFKMNFDKSGNATNFHGVESALQGAWVALVDATDNRHLQSAQPVAPPLTLEQLLDIVKKLGEPT